MVGITLSKVNFFRCVSFLFRFTKDQVSVHDNFCSNVEKILSCDFNMVSCVEHSHGWGQVIPGL